VSRPAGAAPGGQLERREASKLARIVGISFIAILNVVALFLCIGFAGAYVTEGTPAQLGANYIPLWATLFITITCGSVPVITVAVWIGRRRARARERRAIVSDSPSLLSGTTAGTLIIGKGQGAFLRADDEGLLMRNVPWGRVRRIAWTEIKQFTDGRQVKEGRAYWLMVIVLHAGKPVVPLATHQWFRHPDETIQVVRELAERHGIAADLTGRPPDGKGGLWSLIGM
jgi:hypothetical protein